MSNTGKPSEISINEVYQRLVKKAKQDGIITKEEQAILDQVKLGVEEYEEFLNKAYEDGVIDDNETRTLKNMRSHLLKSAWMQADADAEISKDEASLLNLLLKLLRIFDLKD